MDYIWAYPEDSGYQGPEPLTGFTVQASDGTIGTVDRQVDQPGRQHLVVDTGVWVFGKSVLIPAGAVTQIDRESKRVTVGRAKDEIKGAPRFAVDSQTTDPAYLTEVGAYYVTLEGVPTG
ncbi:PRC-barrel domain containing protein [Streptomyces decoyicus]|uniref:PRC-barrel domain containing protein n=1 Tax=Streptomyces decoyicus TaxID=249567 RepID=UPI0038078FD3